MLKTTKTLLAAGITAAALATSAQAADTVKVGFLGGMTGPIESLAPPIADGARLAFANVNEQGGVLGGQKIEMLVGDTTCADATKAADAADRMVNVEKVVALVGPLCSGATISAANNAAIPGGVALISPAATSPALTTLEDKDLVFRTSPSDAYQGEVLSRLVLEAGVKNLAITYVNNDYGKGFADSVEAAYTKAGGVVDAKEAHEDGKADYRSEIGSLASSGSTALLVIGYADGSGQSIVRQSIESGDFDMFFTGDGMVSDELAKDLGGALDGKVVQTRPGTPEVPGSKSFKALATAAKIKIDSPFVANSYDAGFILALAMEQSGSTDRAAIAKAVRDVASAPGEVIYPGEWEKAVAAIKEGKGVNYEGAVGSHEFDAAGDIKGVFMKAVVEGSAVVELGEAK